jgi:hypothetical protein
VIGATEVKAKNQEEVSVYSMVTGNTNLTSDLENGCQEGVVRTACSLLHREKQL